MLATIAEPFDSTDFTYEIKWDGYRSLAFLNSATRLQSRNQKDITSVFPELQGIHQYVRQPGTILDGELIALRDGKPSFLELQKRGQLKQADHIHSAAKKIPVVYVVFDLLYLNYEPVFQKPLEYRRELLLNNLKTADQLIMTNFIETKGIAFFNAISELGLEGVIAKKKNSPYLPGKRVRTWLKFKRKQVNNFVICGYLTNQTSRAMLSSLILGAFLEKTLTFFGMVGTGFTQKELELILKELQKIRTDVCPFSKGFEFHHKNVYWTEPVVVCEIEYLELTDDGNLRHPVFKRFRPDLKPKDCIFEG